MGKTINNAFETVRDILKAMPGKVKVYGKKGGAVVSDVFGKLATSPTKKDGDSNDKTDKSRRAPLETRDLNTVSRSVEELREEIAKLQIEETPESIAAHNATRREVLADILMTDPSKAALSVSQREREVDELCAELDPDRRRFMSFRRDVVVVENPEELANTPTLPAPTTSSRVDEIAGIQKRPRRGRRTRPGRRPRAAIIGSTEEETQPTPFTPEASSPTVARGRHITPAAGRGISTPILESKDEIDQVEQSSRMMSVKANKRRAELKEELVMPPLENKPDFGLHEWDDKEINQLERALGKAPRLPQRTTADRLDRSAEATHTWTEGRATRSTRAREMGPTIFAAEPPVEAQCTEATLEYLQPLLRVAKGRLDGWPVCSFRGWVDRLCKRNYELVKVGEGSFGETFRTKFRGNASSFPVPGKTIFKIIPLRARRGVGSKSFCTVNEVVSEIELLAKMTPIPGFTQYQEAYVIVGPQPPQIVSACRAYIASPDHRPTDATLVKKFAANQLWAVIEMEYAGVDLCRFELSSNWQFWDVFWSAAIALARAEVFARFEHRDLHLANVCVKPRGATSTMDGPLELTKKESNEVKLGFSGLEVTLIDYTLSRAEISPGKVAFNGIGDAARICDQTGNVQFEIYRRMRAEVLMGDPMGNYAEIEAHLIDAVGGWEDYHPRTNLLWLYYLLCGRNGRQKKKIPGHPRMVRLPGSDLNESGFKKCAQKVCDSLGETLDKIFKLLEPQRWIDCELGSAGDLVDYAVKQGWLNESDLES